MPKPARTASLAGNARFVFKGTILGKRPTTGRSSGAATRTVLVRVDEVVEAPHTLSDLVGHEVTLHFKAGARLRPKQRAVFYTSGSVYGEGVTLELLMQTPIEETRALLASEPAGGQDPVLNLRNKDAEIRFAQAAVVASGRVVSVSLAGMKQSTTGGGRRAGARAISARAAVAATTASAEAERLSEHVPLWRDAEIEVTAVHKGGSTLKRATVRFPASTDVRWYKAPKLHVGQEGLFMLHKSELSASRRTGLAAALVDEVYTALHPIDFQPLNQKGGIRHAIVASGGNVSPGESGPEPTS